MTTKVKPKGKLKKEVEENSLFNSNKYILSKLDVGDYVYAGAAYDGWNNACLSRIVKINKVIVEIKHEDVNRSGVNYSAKLNMKHDCFVLWPPQIDEEDLKHIYNYTYTTAKYGYGLPVKKNQNPLPLEELETKLDEDDWARLEQASLLASTFVESKKEMLLELGDIMSEKGLLNV